MGSGLAPASPPLSLLGGRAGQQLRWALGPDERLFWGHSCNMQIPKLALKATPSGEVPTWSLTPQAESRGPHVSLSLSPLEQGPDLPVLKTEASPWVLECCGEMGLLRGPAGLGGKASQSPMGCLSGLCTVSGHAALKPGLSATTVAFSFLIGAQPGPTWTCRALPFPVPAARAGQKARSATEPQGVCGDQSWPWMGTPSVRASLLRPEASLTLQEEETTCWRAGAGQTPELPACVGAAGPGSPSQPSPQPPGSSDTLCPRDTQGLGTAVDPPGFRAPTGLHGMCGPQGDPTLVLVTWPRGHRSTIRVPPLALDCSLRL